MDKTKIMEQRHVYEWDDGISDYKLPRWGQLPEIDYYMDQVITFTEKRLAYILGENPGKLITPSMINNYVKMNIIPPPVKKRYSKEHIALLMMICSLKPVMSITSIKDLIERRLKTEALPEVYDAFCVEQEHASRTTAEKAGRDYEELLRISANSEEAMCILATRMAIYANMEKLFSERIANINSGGTSWE